MVICATKYREKWNEFLNCMEAKQRYCISNFVEMSKPVFVHGVSFCPLDKRHQKLCSKFIYFLYINASENQTNHLQIQHGKAKDVEVFFGVFVPRWYTLCE